jgi:hypothetical protein
LEPKEEKIVSEEIATKFLEICQPYVTEIKTDLLGKVDSSVKLDKIWIANMMGNPDAAENIETRSFIDRQWKTVSVSNPKKEARMVGRKLDLGQREYVGKDGLRDMLNLGTIVLSVQPYTRKEFDRAEGEWFLQRDGNQDVGMRGAAIRSRPPSNFEPDMNWSLDDMRMYLYLADNNAALGIQENDLRTKCASDKSDPDIELQKAKILCMKRLHFRLADPQYRLPTKAEFDDYKNRIQGSPAVAHSDIQEKVLKAQQQLKSLR